MKTHLALIGVIWGFAAIFLLFYISGGLTYALLGTAACLAVCLVLLAFT